MKAPAFDFARPKDVDEAVKLLREGGRPAAGTQSLGPMLNLRIAHPTLLVDVRGIEELLSVSETREFVTLGACVTHSQIEDRRVPDPTHGFLASVAANIAYRAVRNRGTLGGSLAHADPAADWGTCLAAIGAAVLIVGPAGRRTVAVESLMTGVFQVALEPGEVIEAVRIPRLSRDARWGFHKIVRKTGEMAQAIGAVLHDPARGILRAAIGATESVPIVFSDASVLFSGRPEAGLAQAYDAALAGRALDDAGITDAVDRQLHLVALKRAIAQAARR